MAAVEDNIRKVEWQDLADTVLVFVCTDTPYDVWMLILFQDGLFATFLSAFLIFFTDERTCGDCVVNFTNAKTPQVSPQVMVVSIW